MTTSRLTYPPSHNSNFTQQNALNPYKNYFFNNGMLKNFYSEELYTYNNDKQSAQPVYFEHFGDELESVEYFSRIMNMTMNFLQKFIRQTKKTLIV